LEDIINIACVGLNNKDRNVLISLLKLLPTLKNKMRLLQPSLYEKASLIFLDPDTQEVQELWKNSICHNVTQTTIILTKDSEFSAPGVTVIQKPLVMKKLFAALNKELSTEKFIKPINPITHKQKAIKLLVVDDSFPVRKYMERKLPTLIEDKQLLLEFAEHGKEAVEKIKNTAYQLVFMDVIMPDVNGYQVCKWIKKVRPNTKVVMLTSKKSPFDKIKGSMSGCDAYITKPPKDEQLVNVLENLI
jgi:twitching motility two-component system response regulator PilG